MRFRLSPIQVVTCLHAMARTDCPRTSTDLHCDVLRLLRKAQGSDARSWTVLDADTDLRTIEHLQMIVTTCPAWLGEIVEQVKPLEEYLRAWVEKARKIEAAKSEAKSKRSA